MTSSPLTPAQELSASVLELLRDGRARTPAEVVAALGKPPRQIRNALCTTEGLLRLPSPTQSKHAAQEGATKGRGFLYRLDPNFMAQQEALARRMPAARTTPPLHHAA